MNTTPEQNYFALRNVTPDFYCEYRLPHYIKQSLPADKAAAILDIGCGYGQTLLSIQKEGYTRLYGADIAPEAVVCGRQQGLNVELIENLDEYCAKQKQKYDFILMNHVVEHLAKAGIIEMLSKIRLSLMKPGAALLVAVPNAQSNTGCYWAYEDFTHSTIFTAGSLLYVLRAAGFMDIQILDPDGLADSRGLVKWVKSVLLKLYRANRWFWNKVTGSSDHKPSPAVFTFDVKMLAR